MVRQRHGARSLPRRHRLFPKGSRLGKRRILRYELGTTHKPRTRRTSEIIMTVAEHVISAIESIAKKRGSRIESFRSWTPNYQYSEDNLISRREFDETKPHLLYIRFICHQDGYGNMDWSKPPSRSYGKTPAAYDRCLNLRTATVHGSIGRAQVRSWPKKTPPKSWEQILGVLSEIRSKHNDRNTTKLRGNLRPDQKRS